MYNEYFGLNQAPFRITPDTALFYTGGGRGDVLDALVYAITSGEGIVKVVGEVGTGKTMLCRMLEERLPDNVQIAYLANPSLTPEDILHAVALELELDIAGNANRLQVMHRLQETLLARHANNQRVVVLVEEAQSMPVDTLEEIRLLSNLETKNEKLLQIVLFGQPELDDNLSQPQIRQLRERITHSFALTPLAREEVKDYVAFRLRASGYRGRDAFTSDAYRTMSRASEGLTRRVNIIADKAMLAAFADDTHDVSAKHVKSAIADSEFSASNTRRRRSPFFAMGAVASIAIIAAAAVGWYAGNLAGSAPSQSPVSFAPVASDVHAERAAAQGSDVVPADVLEAAAETDQEPVTAVPSVAAQGATATPVVATSSAQGSRKLLADVTASQDALQTRVTPTVRPPAKIAQTANTPVMTSAAGGDTAPARDVVEKASVPVGLQQPASGVAETVANGAVADNVAGKSAEPRRAARTDAVATGAVPASLTATAAGDSPKSASTSAGPVVAPALAGADKSTVSKSMVDLTADSQAAALQTGVDANPPKDRSLLQWRLAQTRQWLQRVAKNRYSIQLLATDAGQRNNLEAFLARRKRAGQIEEVFVYTTRINSREWYGVLFGEFESYSQAREALRKLPPELLLHKPFIRNVKDINALG